MKTAMRIPQTGTQTAATFLQWLVSVGDHVNVGDSIGNAETEKAVVQIEAAESGMIA